MIQNSKLTSYNLMKLLKEAEIMPNLMSIENLEEIFIKLLVNIFNSQRVM